MKFLDLAKQKSEKMNPLSAIIHLSHIHEDDETVLLIEGDYQNIVRLFAEAMKQSEEFAAMMIRAMMLYKDSAEKKEARCKCPHGQHNKIRGIRFSEAFIDDATE